MKFSFVMLTWNRQKYPEKSIPALWESIADKENAEIILMDNASTDGTFEVLKGFEHKYKNVHVVQLDKNYGLNAYKKLFSLTKGDYIVEVDDDVVSYPSGIDRIFEDYFTTFTDYGYLAMDVIQNEFTNGAKPSLDNYVEEERNGKIVQKGPTGGWCTGFRRKDYRKVSLIFKLTKLSFQRCEDGQLQKLFRVYLRLKAGIMKGQYCFHANGPHYAKEFGAIDREIEKYVTAGLTNYVEAYQKYKD